MRDPRFECHTLLVGVGAIVTNRVEARNGELFVAQDQYCRFVFRLPCLISSLSRCVSCWTYIMSLLPSVHLHFRSYSPHFSSTHSCGPSIYPSIKYNFSKWASYAIFRTSTYISLPSYPPCDRTIVRKCPMPYLP